MLKLHENLKNYNLVSQRTSLNTTCRYKYSTDEKTCTLVLRVCGPCTRVVKKHGGRAHVPTLTHTSTLVQSEKLTPSGLQLCLTAQLLQNTVATSNANRLSE